MPVTGSGEIKLRADVNNEVEGNNTDNNVSLRALSSEAGKSVPDALSEFYGYTSCTAPSVTTSPGTTSVTDSGMTIRGRVSNNNGCDITSYGFYFGTDGSSATNNTSITVANSAIANNTTFTSARSSLNSSTTYYYWVWATNSAGTTISSKYTQATAAPAMPLTFNSVTLTSDTYGYTYEPPHQNAHCAQSINSNITWNITNGSGEFNQVTFTQYFNTTYGNSTNNAYGGSCGVQNTSNFDSNQTRQFGHSFNGNAPAYTCRICISDPGSYPVNTGWTAIASKSGYASQTFTGNFELRQ